MGAVRRALSTSGFRTYNATIISGLEEANSAWTSVNYLKQNVRWHGVNRVAMHRYAFLLLPST